jgi:hypothetical protein
VTSSTACLNNMDVTEINLKLTGRILIHDRLELFAVHPWEVVIANVLLELRIGPRVGDQDELVYGRRSTHVTLKLSKLNRVPSSSQFPGVTRLTTMGNNE